MRKHPCIRGDIAVWAEHLVLATRHPNPDGAAPQL